MIFKIDQQIDYLENIVNIQLREGDLLLTGTPENIAPVREGDRLEAALSENGTEIARIVENRILKEARPSHV